MSKGFASIIILLGIAVIILIGGVVVYQKVLAPKARPTPTPSITTTPSSISQPSPTPDLTVSWKTYQSKDLGFSLEYPGRFVISEFLEIPTPSTTGSKFSLILSDGFVAGSVTTDYSAGRGAMFTDTSGYAENGGKIYCLFINNKEEIDRESVKKTVNKNGVEMLIIQGKNDNIPNPAGEFTCTNPGNRRIGVLINLRGSKFRGLGITYTEDSTLLTRSEFDQILSTFKFLD